MDYPVIDPTTYRTMSGYFTTELDSMERLMLIDRPARKIDIFMQHPTDKVTHLMAFFKNNKQTSVVGHWLEKKNSSTTYVICHIKVYVYKHIHTSTHIPTHRRDHFVLNKFY